MSLNPLNKLLRFSKNVTVQPLQKIAPLTKAATTVRKEAVVSDPAYLKTLANPDSHACGHCKTVAGDGVNQVARSKGNVFDGWLCLKCWTHIIQVGRLPVIAPRLPTPKLLQRT
jgi:hypothetical protein